MNCSIFPKIKQRRNALNKLHLAFFFVHCGVGGGMCVLEKNLGCGIIKEKEIQEEL